MLVIAFHFPPVKGSSGIQRTLSLVRHLPDLGWNPVVLTVHPRAYRALSDDQLADIPPDTKVYRAQAWDSSRHLSFRGRYFRATALPDPWMSWRFDGVRLGRKLLVSERIDAIYSTYPIATAVQIGTRLQAESDLPWIVDFRDLMVDPDYPEDEDQRAAFIEIERAAVAQASAVVTTAPSGVAMLEARYPQAKKFQLIENGYDESFFEGNEGPPIVPIADRPVTLIHSGLIYPVDRDPVALFEAVARLKQRGLDASQLRINLRASGDPEAYGVQIRKYGVDDIFDLTPGLPYREALAEMLQADGLLILQGQTCNHLIPAKFYEYVRSRRPVIGLTQREGDTARVMRENGYDAIASLHDPEEIAAVLAKFLQRVRAGSAAIAPPEAVVRCNRKTRAAELADLLDRLTGKKS